MPPVLSVNGSPASFELHYDASDPGITPETYNVTYDFSSVPDGCGPEFITASKYASQDHIIYKVIGGGHTVVFGDDIVASGTPSTETLALPSYLPPPTGEAEGLADYILSCKGGTCTLTWGFMGYAASPPFPYPIKADVYYTGTSIEWYDTRWGYSPKGRRNSGVAGPGGNVQVIQ